MKIYKKIEYDRGYLFPDTWWAYDEEAEPKSFSGSKHRYAHMICQYEKCGNRKAVNINDVRRKKNISCGCYHKKHIHFTRFKDLTNKRYGRLLVLAYTIASNNKLVWICLCDCGKRLLCTTASLNNQNTKSCGCLRIEILRERVKTISPQHYKDIADTKGGRCLRIANTAAEKSEWICSEGHVWEAPYASVKRKDSWCPTCGARHRKFENTVYHTILYSFPDAEQNVRGLLPNKRFELDIWIPSLKRAIELDGSYWHDRPDSIMRDERKNKQCADTGIKLLRIRYVGQRAVHGPIDILHQIIQFLLDI